MKATVDSNALSLLSNGQFQSFVELTVESMSKIAGGNDDWETPLAAALWDSPAPPEEKHE